MRTRTAPGPSAHPRQARALWGWLGSETVSLLGTRVSMIAVPWLVLTTTGSPVLTGLVACAEMAPYVVLKALTGPLVDRLGARRVCVTADLVSLVVVGAIPVLHALDLLRFPVLVLLVAVTGAVRGPGDGAKQALVPVVVRASGVSLERATGLHSACERLASTAGAAVAGALVAAVGPATALALDAVSFGASALLLVATAPRTDPSAGGASDPGDPDQAASYLTRLREGWQFLRHEPVLLAMTGMVAVSNLLDAAFSTVLVPVWARETGGGAGALGLWFGSFSAAAVVGSLLASRYGDRLPRYPVYVGAFLLAGPPRFLLLVLDVETGLGLGPVVAVTVVAGFACGFINPVLGAVLYERVPARLTGRVTALEGAVCWSLLPFGGLLGGLLVGATGLTAALVAVGAAYLVVTLSPLVVPAWRTLDATRPRTSDQSREPDPDLALR
ncbi:MAG: hypothetical protein AVDCRST_MAG36-1241 [uncultured Nocardioidaceae bacterium]|uniref:Major facilitator superfamily (MFS) profile domain-containing protein n=1 Tax=uncultured Nocardioidaceae bacterium TaxID=253824 RepID=A0A6J4LP11_9ACTN|nr:MAG: hypothetical protein AVDCRST_MAG36-1241 [uncultured Nocardioidaceae bacterium]